jgi:hypothetical protein
MHMGMLHFMYTPRVSDIKVATRGPANISGGYLMVVRILCKWLKWFEKMMMGMRMSYPVTVISGRFCSRELWMLVPLSSSSRITRILISGVYCVHFV